MKIGFIGLGNMGLPMAKNLIQKGHEVIGYDMSPSALKNIEQAGGKATKELSEVATDVDALVTMLPNGKIVKSLYIPENGLFKYLDKKTLLIDCSTIAVSESKELHELADENGFAMVDAPVSGGTAAAEQGTLTFIVGGPVPSYERASEVLKFMGTNIFHAGDAGAGQVAKMCNNMLLAVQMIGTCEAINLGLANGLYAETLSEIMKASSGNNWVLEKYNPEPGVMPNVPSSKEYQGGFLTELMLKDLNLAVSGCQQEKVSSPMSSLALNLYNLHTKNGNGRLDFSSIHEMLKGVKDVY